MNKIVDFMDVDVKNFYMLVGKGYNIVFGFKDVIMVIVGLGNVGDFKEFGVVVFWQIGCGIDILIVGEFESL